MHFELQGEVERISPHVRRLQELIGGIIPVITQIRNVIINNRLREISNQMNEQENLSIAEIIEQRTLTERKDRLRELVRNRTRAQGQPGMTTRESAEAQQAWAQAI